MNKKLGVAAFCVGLAAVCWVGFGYIRSNPLALTMTTLIGAFYLMGALELRRFHQATSTLATALTAIPENLPSLATWLDKVHPALRNPVRQRIEGERVGLPGPVMTPYLVGLLVLLGMLGTFLGMVVTLDGAVLALESTTDLPTIRAALSAPVKGLGLAFGTSVAGVAASAMLGLVSAVCRRERLQALQVLDTRIATTLRAFSLAHLREETFKTLQSQARVIPDVLGQLQAMMAHSERQSQALNDRLIASQEAFFRNTTTVYADLASSVDKSLKDSLTSVARIAGTAIEPVAQATMAGIARETTLLHERIADTVTMQLEGLSARHGSSVSAMENVWTTALARHERSSDDLTQRLHSSLQNFAETFEQRSARLLTSVEAAQSAGQAALTQTWRDALAQHQHTSDTLSGALQTSLASLVQACEQQPATLMAMVEKSHVALQADLAASDQQRQAALAQSLESMAASLQQNWQQAGAQTLAQQAQICDTLERTARDIHAQAEAHARNTITEIAQLTQTAAEAPRAAAEVIGQLRQKLSDSMVQDNALLEERHRIMETLRALLDAIQHAATEQRGSIDALVASSAALLQQVSTQFAEKIEAESDRLTAVAAEVTGSAIEVSSLGEAFGFGVQQFSESSEALMATLARIEGSLDKSAARSDEQLGYYVAQAREIIDLSILSQKQIVEELQQLSGRQAALAAEAS